MEDNKQTQKHRPYSFIRLIGKGAFGQVFEAEHNSLKTKVAIKQTMNEYINIFDKEVFSLNNLTHPNIVSFINVFSTNSSQYVVMELAPGCDLHTYLERNNMKLEENMCRIIGRQLSSACCYMHSKRIAHRDIKPDNIMIDETTVKIKLVDFGLSGTVLNGKLLTACCGTDGYVAPEICRKQPYDLTADMWSVGVTFYIMITGIVPDFTQMDKEEISEHIEEIIKIRLLTDDVKNTTAHFQNMLARLLQPEPSKRMDSRQLSKHPWITNNSQEPLKTYGYKPLPSSVRFKIVKQLALLTNSTVRQTIDIIQTRSDGSLAEMYRLLRHSEYEKRYIESCAKKADRKRALDDSDESLRNQGQKRPLDDYSESRPKAIKKTEHRYCNIWH